MQVSVHNRRRERCSANTLNRLVQRRTEQLAQTATLLLVPAASFKDVFPGLGEKNDAAHGLPRAISTYTSSHATPSGPSRSRRSRRRSSSSWSAGLSTKSSGERLRQRSSIRSYFSSAVSFETSIAGLAM